MGQSCAVSEKASLLCEEALVIVANPSQILTNRELFFSFPEKEMSLSGLEVTCTNKVIQLGNGKTGNVLLAIRLNVFLGLISSQNSRLLLKAR